ncbi:HlyD family type I secretion periplasmic adaptor subunit [Pseudahrensia aquimaris]|uniref:Membrane fusion protein (MFP) family protein n=1 Tax=Pseudahrensia aquimaris TaxID=744461 RepID=A0ABW3FES8_9HYPH
MTQSKTREIEWNVNAKVDSRPIVRAGLWSIGFTMIVFFFWGSFAHLESAVITPGTLVSEGRNKLIQHSTGGRVSRILVREGMYLTAGQAVLELDETKAAADLSRLEARYASLNALKTRLQAERLGGTGFDPVANPDLGGLRLGNNPLDGRSGSDVLTNIEPLALRGTQEAPSVANTFSHDAIAAFIGGKFDQLTTAGVEPPRDALMDSQRDAYNSGRDLLDKEIAALERKAETLVQQKAGHRARIESQKRLLQLTREEVRRLAPLASSGYVPRNRLRDRQRSIAELQGNIAAMELDAAAFSTQKAEIDVQIERTKAAKSDAASKEYARIVAELAEIEDQRKAARATLRDMVVRSPVSGNLTSLKVTTEGGVFGSGDVIGEIVPEGAPLLVEARVQPSDIDFVRIGQEADIAVTAFDRRLDDTLTGRVVYRSADAEQDEKTGEQYFVARLRFDDSEKNAANRAKLQAGMQGEVYIHTGSQTFLTYLTKPLMDSFRRAFRER